ncbi:MAG: GNAT family N-acetyltransferase [Clostridiaceae bacterium]|nr:GNAT family N-acetyltransferase [Eubacteriales bacterium]MDY0119483.1 GNAT family N-acetyltransferase [Clostridia bacterium]NLG30373.1 GNAT family N-acetyltransferase [Clostridiaceae bacterium]
MLVHVTSDNELIWNALCRALWPHLGKDKMLFARRSGKLPYEFLYMEGQEARGFLSLSIRHDYVEGTDSSPVAYIEGIYVKPDARHRGIASEMIFFAKQWAKEHGCRELASDCDVHDKDSEGFHKGVGFMEASRNIHFVMKLG